MPQIAAAITTAVTAFKATAVGTFLFNTVAGRLLTSVALTALSRAMQPKPKVPGIKTSATAGGGVNPCSFILGTYASSGVAVCPPMSHGNAGKTPNAYLTYVIELSDLPGLALGRLVIDGEYVTLGPTPDPTYGSPVEGRLAGFAWCKFHDGSQTTADPMLLAKYGGYPDRPWTADMIGRGLAYAILTFRYNRERFNTLPQVRFEMSGIPLYDPRQDTSVGGSGAQRWATPSTWARTGNPMVMAYNIKRGIALPDGNVWGGGFQAQDLPLAEWVAMMDTCDVAVPLAAGGTEPRYRAGYEVTTDDEPAEVIEELFKACSGQAADIGGIWKPRAGAPGLPIAFITDDDLVITSPGELTPFPGLAATWNGISATYPEPQSLWESKEAPPRYSATWETEDGGRRLVADLGLPAVPYAMQVQRLMQAYISDERRFRRHSLVLPPSLAHVEPLDTIAWTSVANGYVAKLFEVAEVSEDILTLVRRVALREVDPADYDWAPGLELPTSPVPPIVVQPVAQAVPGFDLQATTITDAAGTSRRPALRLVWDGNGLDDVRAIEWQVRRSGTATVILSGSTHLVSDGSLTIADGILPATDYEGRARCVVDRPSDWTAWDPATTDGTYITDPDFGPGGVSGLFRTAGLSAPRIVAVLPSAGPNRFVGELVLLTTDLKLYRWTGSAWTAAVPTTDLTGKVASSQLLIADLSNLCENPGFEQGTAGWGAVSGGGGYTIASSGAAVGANCAARIWAAGFAANSAWRNNLAFDTAPGRQYRISGQVKRNAGGVCTKVGFRMSWLDGTGAEIATSDASLTQAETSTGWQPVANIVTAPTGAVQARAELVVIGHSAGTFWWDDVYCYRANGGELIVDGSIFGNHIAANSMTAGIFAAGAVRAQDMLIDGALDISATDAGFRMGKSGPADFGADGIYMGRSVKLGGGTGYGFLMQTTAASGLQRWIQSTPDVGLNIVNAAFGLMLPVTGNLTTITTSQTVTLPAGTKTISMTLMGAGGGGAVEPTAGHTPATAGGATSVKLFDGATDTGIQWSSAGGAAGSAWGGAGEGSAMGAGGAAGQQITNGGPDNRYYTYSNGGTASGNGAGGGGGYKDAKGGGKAVATTVSLYDVSGLAAPKLVITIGAGGAGGIETADAKKTNGGNGSPGMVKLQSQAEVVVPAGVVPHVRSGAGQFVKAANATGAAIFPDLKPGIWILQEDGGAGLALNGVVIDAAGTTLKLANASSACFVAEIRPDISIGNGNARTINWQFFSLKAQ